LGSELAVLVPACGAEVEPGWVLSTRHSSLILLTLAKVVKSLPAIRSMTSRPRAASRRSPDADSEPSGKANAAATLNRSGVFGVI
jgi:hypothetical protein